MISRDATIFLLDVDDTLLDNDALEAHLRRHLERAFGQERAQRYWAIFESLREELGYADYLGALQRYRLENLLDPHLLEISLFLVDYPFRQLVYPRALEVVRHLGKWGPRVILSDGDVVFQPRKVQQSGLWDAVGGQVLIYIHKEQMLDDVERRCPAEHYVLIDDKLRILAAVKDAWGERVTTVFPRQGHYANDPELLGRYPLADVNVDQIADLLDWTPDRPAVSPRKTAGAAAGHRQ